MDVSFSKYINPMQTQPVLKIIRFNLFLKTQAQVLNLQTVVCTRQRAQLC
jgi:hypothetical protein